MIFILYFLLMVISCDTRWRGCATSFGSNITAFAGIASKQLSLFINETWRQRAVLKRTADDLYFLFTQFASTQAAEYSIVLLHSLFSFLLVRARRTVRGPQENLFSNRPRKDADLHPGWADWCREKK